MAGNISGNVCKRRRAATDIAPGAYLISSKGDSGDGSGDGSTASIKAPSSDSGKVGGDSSGGVMPSSDGTASDGVISSASERMPRRGRAAAATGPQRATCHAGKRATRMFAEVPDSLEDAQLMGGSG